MCLRIHDINEYSGLKGIVHISNYYSDIFGNWVSDDIIKQIDANLLNNYYNKRVTCCYVDEPQRNIYSRVTNVLNRSKYTLDTLYATTIQTYNPIENYNMIETEENEIDLSHTLQQTVTTYPAETTTTTTGGNTTTHYETTNESADFRNIAKDVDTADALTVVQNVGQYTDYDVTEKHDFIDTSDKAGKEFRENTLTRSGNIGVTTTQQMLEQERNIAVFNFVQYVTDIIISEICSTVWGGDEF